MVEGFRDAIGSMSSQELLEGATVEFTPGDLQRPGHVFGLVEHLVRERNRSFHTKSITAFAGRVQAKEPVSVGASARDPGPHGRSLPTTHMAKN